MARYFTDTYPVTSVSLADYTPTEKIISDSDPKPKHLKTVVKWMVRDFTNGEALKWHRDGDYTIVFLKGQKSIDIYKDDIDETKDLDSVVFSTDPIVLKPGDECLLMDEDRFGIVHWELISYADNPHIFSAR